MRVKLSDATARGEYERAGGQDAAGYCARVEARSILAENEPQDDPDWPRRYTAHSVYYAILADTLAALCAAPDVAAYLAELQVRQ
jgi:hypothetical protein